MDHVVGKNKSIEAISTSPSLATMMAVETKGGNIPHGGLHASTRNPASTPISNVKVNKNNNDGTGGSFHHRKPYSSNQLHLQQDGPPTLLRRNSDHSHGSKSKPKGKQRNTSQKTSRQSESNNAASTKNKSNTLAPKKESKKTKNPLKVLGIALIVDQKGTGARMLARYPTSQASINSEDEDGDHREKGNGNENDDAEEEEEDGMDDRRRHRDDDLFFTLTARQMAKLFRTKRSLCNQPMTLRVNKTIFCCHAVLLEDESNNNDEEDKSLSLFSVVVALAPTTRQSALPFASFWDVGGFGEDTSDLERYIRQGGTNKSNDKKISTQSEENNKPDKSVRAKQKKKQTAARVSSVFLAIRRVHISLVRFCRALEREENRCGYVTYQSRILFQTRNERTKQLDLMRNRNSRQGSLSPNPSGNGGNGSGDRSPLGTRGTVGLGGGLQHHHTPRHSRQSSFLSTPGAMNTVLSESSLKSAFDNNDLGGDTMGTVEQEQEKEQEILELMLACNPKENPEGQQHPYQKRQHGNLVRDLVAVFHSLSRNDHEHPPTPNSLLCERDAVVYVNQHFAIPIDAAGLSGHSQSSSFSRGTSLLKQHKIGSAPIGGGMPDVRPYYTLLFPHASPSKLLQTFYSSGSAPPQQMEHILQTVNPQKPLTQIASDANLPMHTTMQIASFLIAHDACTTSPVVSSRSRLTCFGSDSMQRIPELALDFDQAFPGVSLFGVVSFLTTSSRHLGDAMAILTNTENEEGAWLRESLLASSKYRYRDQSFGDGDMVMGFSIESSNKDDERKNESSSYSPTIRPSYAKTSRGKGAGPKPAPEPMAVHNLKDLEEVLFSIAVWLLSHKVLVQLQEYMVVVAEVLPPNLIRNVDNESASSIMVSPPTENVRGTSFGSLPTSNSAVKNPNSNDWDDNLFKELLEMDYLNGDISIMALSWRMAIDPRKLRRWGLRHRRVRVISRIPSPGDDWEPEKVQPSVSPPPVPPPSSSQAPAPSASSSKALQ